MIYYDRIDVLEGIDINNINMIYYDRIGVLEGIDINKTNESKECNIYHYCFFSR